MKKRIKIRRKSFSLQVLSIIAILLFFLLAWFLKPIFLKTISNSQESLWNKGRNFSIFFSGGALREKYDETRIENQRLYFENVKLKNMEKENEELREILGLEIHKEFEFIDSYVISKEAETDCFFINKGINDGMKKDMIVINPQGSLIGQIKEVFDNNSLIQLISNSEIKLDLEIGDENIEGIAQGVGGLKIAVKKLPKEEVIEVGDIVSTGRLQKDFPRGLLVGKVIKVKKTDLSPFQEIEIKTFFKLNDLNMVLVITDF